MIESEGGKNLWLHPNSLCPCFVCTAITLATTGDERVWGSRGFGVEFGQGFRFKSFGFGIYD